MTGKILWSGKNEISCRDREIWKNMSTMGSLQCLYDLSSVL